jgi:hypothetical protein
VSSFKKNLTTEDCFVRFELKEASKGLRLVRRDWGAITMVASLLSLIALSSFANLLRDTRQT